MNAAVSLRLLSAEQELGLQASYPRLIPVLMGRGLGLSDAAAVAYNATLLSLALPADPPFKGGRGVLRRLSLVEIAELCEEYCRMEHGEVEHCINDAYREESP